MHVVQLFGMEQLFARIGESQQRKTTGVFTTQNGDGNVKMIINKLSGLSGVKDRLDKYEFLFYELGVNNYNVVIAVIKRIIVIGALK